MRRDAEFDELDEMIRAGWGDQARADIPSDWRTRQAPEPEPYTTRVYYTAKKIALMDPDAAATLCSELRRTIGRPRGARSQRRLSLEERARKLRAKLQRQARAKARPKPNTNERNVEYMRETGRAYTVNSEAQA